MKKYVVVDIETTGFTPDKAGMTEIVGISFDKDFDHHRTVINQLTKPFKFIPKVIQELTGITNPMVAHAEDWKVAMTRFAHYSSTYDLIVIAHNAKFEKKFIEAGAYMKYAAPLQYICTQALFLVYKYGTTSIWRSKGVRSKLQIACEEFDIPYNTDKAHRAEYDVLVTAQLAKKLIDHFGLKKSLEISEKFISGEHYGETREISIFDVDGGLYE